MNLSYFRKSNLKPEEIATRLKAEAEKLKMTLSGELELPMAGGTLYNLCKPEWVQGILSQDKNLLGLIPCSVLIKKEGDGSVVGIGNPQLLGSVAHLHEIESLLAEMDTELRALINTSAGVDELKPAKIKLYSTVTCPYCKMEKKFLEEKKVDFEYVLVDQDEKAAAEMVQKTGQMGVPVTEIAYEGGESEYIIGFDRPRLEQLLGLKS